MRSQDLEGWTEFTPPAEDVTSEEAGDVFWSSEIIRMNLPDMPHVFFRIEVEE